MSSPINPEAIDTDGHAVTKNTAVGDVDMKATTMEGFKNSIGGYGGLDADGIFIYVDEIASGESTIE
jgi:hypothetical protein